MITQLQTPKGPYEALFTDMRHRLANSGSWLKGAPARICQDGPRVPPTSKHATCFCLTGAAAAPLQYLVLPLSFGEVLVALNAMAIPCGFGRFIPNGFGCAIQFNDALTTTHEDILEFLDVAILNAKLGGV